MQYAPSQNHSGQSFGRFRYKKGGCISRQVKSGPKHETCFQKAPTNILDNETNRSKASAKTPTALGAAAEVPP